MKVKSLDNRRRRTIEKLVLREVELLRNPEANPAGFKRWRKFSDVRAMRGVMRWAIGV